MNSISLQGILYTIPENSHVILQSYLVRIKTYIEKNNLDSNLYEDIEKRIGKRFTFLSQGEKGISQGNVLGIINEIGEPEEIFNKSKGGQHWTSPAFKSMFQRKPYRNSKEWIIAWVCAWLGDYFEIDVIWFRIFFLSSLFLFGTGVVLYIVLAIILPEKSTILGPSWDSSYEKDRYMGDSQSEALAQRMQDSQSWEHTKDTLSFMGKGLWFILELVIFGILGGIFLGIGIGAMVLASFMFSGLILENQIVFAYIPMYAGYLVGIWGISALLLAIASFGRIFQQKRPSSAAIFGGIIVLMISIFWTFAIWLQTATNYTNEYSIVKNVTLAGFSGSGLTLEFQGTSNRNMSIHSPIEFETKLSTDGKIRVETTSYIRAKDTPSSQVILTALRDLEITQTAATIIVSLPKEGNFNREVPLAFLYRSVVVYLPSDVQLTFGSSGIETYKAVRSWGR